MSGGHRAIDVFVAGVCEGEPGPGGWGAVLRYGKHRRELQGSELASTAPNRMLLTAAAAALGALTRPLPVRLYADRAILGRAAVESSRVVWVGTHDEPDGTRATELARDALREAVRKLEARCLHDLVTRQCWQCRPTSTTLPNRVKVTSGGLVFHLDEGCAALHGGWRKVERRGGLRSDLTTIPTADALAKGLGACESCCRGFKL